VILQDDPHRQIVRIGDTVRRPVYPWSASVHLLLQHLSDVGFPYSPRFLGIDEENREVLTYLEGDSGPDGWAKVVDPAGLVAMAELLRDYHAAVRSYRRRGPPPAANGGGPDPSAGRRGPPAPGRVATHRRPRRDRRPHPLERGSPASVRVIVTRSCR